MLQSPIFHVNGDDPEACVHVAALAFEYRQRFHKDVVIDMVCYRRHGHNEGDDPSYTQPLMYKAIGERRSVRKLFVEALVKRGELTLEEAEETLADFQRRLQVALDETRQTAPAPSRAARPPAPQGVLPHVATGVDRAVLDQIFDHLADYPPAFVPHPKLAKQFDARSKLYHEGGEVEWATAEALAVGSLIVEGTDVRLSGEDSRRGTFSQRHAALVDFDTEQIVDAAQRPGRVRGQVPCVRLAPVGVRGGRASSTATPWPTRTPSSCGRPSSATSSTARRSSSTSTWWRPRTSGARRPASCSSCPTATRGRALSTRARASSGS